MTVNIVPFLLLLGSSVQGLETGDIARRAPENVLDFVDPLIGSNSGGNVFAGASLPYGMAKG
jgi:hypothetical protein